VTSVATGLPSASVVVIESVPSSRGLYCSRSLFTSTLRKRSTGGTINSFVPIWSWRSTTDVAAMKMLGMCSGPIGSSMSFTLPVISTRRRL